MSDIHDAIILSLSQKQNPVYNLLRSICEKLTEVELRAWQVIQDDIRIVSVLAQISPSVDITVSHWLLGDTVTVINIRVGKNNSEWRVDEWIDYNIIDKRIVDAKNSSCLPVRLFS